MGHDMSGNFYRSENPYTDPLFTRHINKPIKTIVEIGCNRYQYTYDLLKVYNPDIVYAFEGHPKCYDYCEKNITDPRLVFVPKAVCSYNGTTDFYGLGFTEDTTCSSVYERVHLKELQEPKITVSCTRLDTFFENKNHTKIDLLCMDIQGSELSAMESLGEMIKDVDYIILELTNPGVVVHKDCPPYEEYINFFNKNGYEIVETIWENFLENNIMVVKK